MCHHILWTPNAIDEKAYSNHSNLEIYLNINADIRQSASVAFGDSEPLS